MAPPATPRTLSMLGRVRRIVTEEARQGLAAAIAAETAAEAAVRDIADAIARERAIAADLNSDDLMVESYIAWLAEAGQQLEAARLKRDTAAASTTQARSRLNLAKAAEQTVERHIAAAVAAGRLEDLQREQIELDEVAQAAHPGKVSGPGTTFARSPLANPLD